MGSNQQNIQGVILAMGHKSGSVLWNHSHLSFCLSVCHYVFLKLDH